MAVTPGYPAEDPELFAQTSHYGTRSLESATGTGTAVAAGSVSVASHWIAAKHVKANKAEINVNGYLRDKNYTRPP